MLPNQFQKDKNILKRIYFVSVARTIRIAFHFVDDDNSCVLCILLHGWFHFLDMKKKSVCIIRSLLTLVVFFFTRLGFVFSSIPGIDCTPTNREIKIKKITNPYNKTEYFIRLMITKWATTKNPRDEPPKHEQYWSDTQITKRWQKKAISTPNSNDQIKIDNNNNYLNIRWNIFHVSYRHFVYIRRTNCFFFRCFWFCMYMRVVMLCYLMFVTKWSRLYGLSSANSVHNLAKYWTIICCFRCYSNDLRSEKQSA